MEFVKTGDGRLRVWQTFRGVAPDELFSYWTEPAKLKAWWPDEATIDPVSGGQYRYVLRGGHVLSGTFSEVDPGKRLAFSFQEGESGAEKQVVVDFEPRDADTLLTVTQGFYGEDEAGKGAFQSQLDDWANLFRKLKTAAHS